MRNHFIIIILIISILTLPNLAFAGDAATIVFREGYIAKTNYGFKVISDAFKNQSSSPKILDLNLEGGSFLINISEVVIVCKDDCPGLEVSDPRTHKKQ